MKTKLIFTIALLMLGLAGCGSQTKGDQTKICQSCAMPLVAENDFGTEADSTLSSDYCVYCYQDGAFTYDCTMDEMLSFCEQHIDQLKPAGVTPEDFMEHLREVFPTLKRWAE